jgi:hypothetical protein
MGRLTLALRLLRADPRTWGRVGSAPRAAARSATTHDVSISARYAGRSCYLRPLFDRPRQWAAQRTPRSTQIIQK